MVLECKVNWALESITTNKASGGAGIPIQFSWVQFSHSVMSNSLWPHESQHVRPPCPSPTPGVHSNPSPSSWWCHPTISSSVVPFSSCPQSLPASGSYSMSQLFASGGPSIVVSASASVLPVSTQDWSSLGWTGWISLNSSWAISNPKSWCCESATLNMPANLENSAVTSGLEKVSFHLNPK